MPNRQSTRKSDHNYQQGVYHVTICTQNRVCLFGEVVDNAMRLNPVGQMVSQQWLDLPKRFPNLELDEFVVMPNHIHGILSLSRATTRVAPTIRFVTVGHIIGAFKSLSTDEYIRNVDVNQWPAFDKKIWQRNYHDQILESMASLDYVREYIQQNPDQWNIDPLYQTNPSVS